MTWWILTFLHNIRTMSALHTLATTNVKAHQFMAWSHYPPDRHRITKVVRGKIVDCGFRYIWDTPIIREQREEGDTLVHSFAITNLPSWYHVWYYIFSPIGPSGRECQGPLMHILPFKIPEWPKQIYVGTKLKGVFRTDDFTGPGLPQPTWKPFSVGLHSLKVFQLCPDPRGPDRRHFAIAGDPGSRVVYRREPTKGTQWVPILTNADACHETESDAGNICWIANNLHISGEFYVLFNSALTYNGTWCIRTSDYGKTWHGFQIYPGFFNYEAGNISVGTSQGTSPYGISPVLYAALCTTAGGKSSIFVSTNNGLSWDMADSLGASIQTPRCIVDPTDQSFVYTGVFGETDSFFELYRSPDHGSDMAKADGPHHLGTFIMPIRSEIWIHATDDTWLRVLKQNHLWRTTDYGLTWTDPGPTQFDVGHMRILSPHPNNLYLARGSSAPGAPWPEGPHVLFISTDEGITLQGKSGNHPQYSDGQGDSIPYDCGGLCEEGIMHTIIT